MKYILIFILLFLLFGCKPKEKDVKPRKNDNGFVTTSFEAPVQQKEKMYFFEPDIGMYRWYDKQLGIACYGWHNNTFRADGAMAVSCVKVN